MTNCVISQTYFEIYLVYDTLCHIPGISRNMSGISLPSHLVVCLEYVRDISDISFPSHLVICLVYVRDIPDISFPSHLGICQGYTRHIPLLVKRPAVAIKMAGCAAARAWAQGLWVSSWVFNVQLKTAKAWAICPWLHVLVSKESCRVLQLELDVSLEETLPFSCSWRWRECQAWGRRRSGGSGSSASRACARRLLERAQFDIWK